MCKFGRLTLRSSRKPTLGLKSQKEVLNSLEKKLTCILAYLRLRFKHVLSVRLLTFFVHFRFSPEPFDQLQQTL